LNEIVELGRLNPFPWKVGLAPLAGFNDPAYRLLCRELGAQWVIQGLVSSEGLTRKSAKTESLLRFDIREKPVFAQLFGADPARMAEAALRVEALGFDGLDLNFGCPDPSVVRGGAGAALMGDRARAEAVVRSVRHAVKWALTMKIRLGWRDQHTFMEVGRMAEDCGADAIILHPRTGSQGFRGKADWGCLAQLKKALRIPVVGSGDVRSGAEFQRMIAETGCDGVLIGRAALRQPWVFRDCLAVTEGKEYLPPQLEDVILRYLQIQRETESPQHALRGARLHLLHFLHGFPQAGRLRAKVATCRTWSELQALAYRQFKRSEGFQ
jgi:tRNA-dihydrouridine synthase B